MSGEDNFTSGCYTPFFFSFPDKVNHVWAISSNWSRIREKSNVSSQLRGAGIGLGKAIPVQCRECTAVPGVGGKMKMFECSII